MKRFKITKEDTVDTAHLCNTTQEVYDYLKGQNMGLTYFYITCNVDHIEVHSDEFMEMYPEEKMEDLQQLK